MRAQRRATYTWLLTTLFVTVLGCSPSTTDNQPADSAGEQSSSAGGSDRTTIAVIPKQTGGEFWETVEQGARRAGTTYDVDIRWEGTVTETEIAEQNKIIEGMVTLAVDGLVVAPLNARATQKGVDGAADAGIPVVVFDSGIDGDRHLSFIATDNRAGGSLAAEEMAQVAAADGNVIALRFLQGTGSTEARIEGFVATATSHGLKIAADPYCEDGTIAGAKKTASNVLENFIEGQRLAIDGIFACNLYTALGLAAALDDLRKGGITVDAIVIGFDTSPKLLDGLEAGTIHALVSQRPEMMGFLAVETMVKHLRGESVDARVDTGVELVTKVRLDNEPEIRKLVGRE